MRISELIGLLESHGEFRYALNLALEAEGKPDRDYPSLEELCATVYRSEVIPGVDSYGLSPAANALSFFSAILHEHGKQDQK